MRLPLVTLLVTLLVSSCGGARSSPDLELYGIKVWLADYPHDDLEEYLQACLEFHSLDHLEASLKFYSDDVGPRCGWPEDSIAGCAFIGTRVAIVADRENLRETAACHEISHLILREWGHDDPKWKDINELF